ncbi:DUF3068 domain-containing protein [Streptomonospora litoralis]|uniref:DUF3068 domain-containing protein n=1 Tax=Streptomonospora litoralis TaxID=2498135 RepID=A0A4P6PX16_9ACTN|nr:DUF3068 domain-containing protein [Streptomonospora litoralis]QBI52786.1 hypothetical protein EKD16_04895 [Streptomonospora litoralis]
MKADRAPGEPASGLAHRAAPEAADARPREGRRSGASVVLARNGRLIALAAAAFLLTAALMLRFYVAAELAMVPPRMELTMRLTDDSGAYLDTGTWRTVRGAEVQRRTEVHGEFAPGNPEWTTWRMSTEVTSGDETLAHHDRRAVVDRATATAVNCCGEHVDGDRAVRQAGLVLLWPAGGTWNEYPFYDADIRAAPPMVFAGRDTVDGLAVRRYVQRIDATQVPDSARPVPAEALGMDRSGTVSANRWLTLERTYWVEPVTGRVVDAREARRETLRPETGGARRMMLEADLRMTEELVAAKAREARELRTLLLAARTWLPAGLGAAGGVLLLLTAWRVLRARSTPAEGAGDATVDLNQS